MKTNCCGTTVFGIVTKNGIAIGADSMATRYRDGHSEIFRKLRAIRGSVIACEGLGTLNICDGPELPDLVLYRADQWMAEIESDPRIEFNANARTIVSFIEEMHPFVELVGREEVVREFYKFQIDSNKGYLADFLVASASVNELLMIRVRARMELVSHPEPPEWKIVFDSSSDRDRRSPIDPFVRDGAGKLMQIDDAFGGNGDCYQEMVARTNGSFMRLIDGDEISLDELRDVVRCAISLEAKANPKQVGPPFVVATLQPGKPISVASYRE